MRCQQDDRTTLLVRRAGFSIIELLVVVTLVLALTSIIAPFRLTPTRQVENAAHQIAAQSGARTHRGLGYAQPRARRRSMRRTADTSRTPITTTTA